MLKLFSRLKRSITGDTRPERIDAKRIYAGIMKQARYPGFYTPEFVSDDTDGRMEWLSAHLAVVMHALHKHGADGATLSQAIYDVMVDDFDIALREEGLSDSGVKHRIKPLAKMYLTRARSYAHAFDGGEPDVPALLKSHVVPDATQKNANRLSAYLTDFSAQMGKSTLDQIAGAEFSFPKF
jgi:cytochrome b pre-mRNA-processing protein 3